MKTLVLAENEKAARELCAGARAEGDVVLFALADEAAVTGCADKVIRVAVPEGAMLDDVYATVLSVIEAEGVEKVYAEPTIRIKNIVGQVSAKLHTAAITDATAVEGVEAKSMYFGGVAEIKQRPVTSVALYTIGSGVFDAAGVSGTDTVETVDWVAPDNAAKVVNTEALPPKTVNLEDADVIVAAGRGFAEEADLDLARDLCGKIGGELGCTRPIAETEGWMPKETYIGISGLILNPSTYVGIGTSGQMQHMVGVNRAKTIFAINKDKNAPIFKQCDYGLVGDLKTVLPALIEEL